MKPANPRPAAFGTLELQQGAETAELDREGAVVGAGGGCGRCTPRMEAAGAQPPRAPASGRLPPAGARAPPRGRGKAFFVQRDKPALINKRQNRFI